MRLISVLPILTLFSLYNYRDVVVGHVIPNNDGSEVVLKIEGNNLELYKGSGNGSSWLQMVLVFARHSSNSQPQLLTEDAPQLTIESTEAPVVCKDGFVLLESKKCYFFSNKAESWQDALKSCQAMGTTLAYPLNEGENTVLVNYLKNNFEGTVAWYLGASDVVIEGHFLWAHSNSSIGYADWSAGQPDNNGNNDDCLHVYKPFGWKWNDTPCNNPYNYICQQ